jgi:hypothetical protein
MSPPVPAPLATSSCSGAPESSPFEAHAAAKLTDPNSVRLNHTTPWLFHPMVACDAGCSRFDIGMPAKQQQAPCRAQ